ncbi:MAG TPA: 2,3-bisphosphoglycerate-independent phosphoglycerate mutase [Sulfurovum sp.]|jgi:2,3-bisphosphoglycerate-independent phosphoglycerate mutase|nr:MAG: phosphoglycerate mutase (2,3-diphosphoglycerate-independent) [Sulfurovum sp. 35-42-20]OYY55940.1 MAG: phosphoglycerate mutase (2,3-diphosphoglycerate-independent) [Sulfurovum sp. 28-43-6]OYZ26899.1 MAG: phosphoglycerate mutase (2,3-diphosphoglycerate-independent) [Sulfurovum sp. 16-42-52]OYZ49558.1 MAG: phosphoglycerate mutase (2,3-diphosphoglycerate-independent) [Sulfurovum sp. 24-42-9]OZA45898.1 MAG: phosphoglycerate mutase (2,3-diphosphoglycerate-independent) [Sulfurovum sp. 17-42-90
MKAQKTILIITDGIGCKPDSTCNAFKDAVKPTYDTLFQTAPRALISTHGLSVGLPEGQMGNSEVGHMTIGAGRILYQDLVKITLALEDKSIEENDVLNDVLAKSERVHLVGLLSDGGVHSHIEHTIGLAQLAEKRGKKVFLHLITDGRDVSPTSAKTYVSQIEAICNEAICIATVGGRFFTMDRDNRWERVEKGYAAIAEARPLTALTPQAYIEQSYAKKETDEFIEPVAFDGYEGLQEGDVVIMTNFRSDRAREITAALGDETFAAFKRKWIPLHIATMTQYDASFTYPILFPKVAPKHTLAEVISEAGLRQLHTAETEKYAHVTFFLNGGTETPMEAESRVLIPSPDVKTYDMKPEMSAPQVGDAVITAMDEAYDFVVVNFANGDMVGHTGNYEAARLAVNAVDTQLGRIIAKAKEQGYAIVLTSDHGNCEEMRDAQGHVLTNHTVGEVWCFVLAEGVTALKEGCGLNNVAPTVLKLMGLAIPQEMDEPLI